MNTFRVAVPILALGLLPSCASGPVVPVAPTVQVLDFNSTRITPDAIRFVGKVRIQNQMRGPLEVEKLDYSADLHDQPMFDRTFDQFSTVRKRGWTTVTLPFEVAMKDIVGQAEDVLAEEGVRVRLRGTVRPVGFEPIDFEAVKVVPVPLPPVVALTGVDGDPLAGAFSVSLSVHNPNAFPVSFGSVDTYVKLNGKRYDLLRTESFADIQAGGSGRMTLAMRNSHGKGLSMLINIARNQSSQFTIGGNISCMSPHGLIEMPVELDSTAAPGR